MPSTFIFWLHKRYFQRRLISSSLANFLKRSIGEPKKTEREKNWIDFQNTIWQVTKKLWLLRLPLQELDRAKMQLYLVADLLFETDGDTLFLWCNSKKIIKRIDIWWYRGPIYILINILRRSSWNSSVEKSVQKLNAFVEFMRASTVLLERKSFRVKPLSS